MTTPTITDWAAECEAIWQATLDREREYEQIRKQDQLIRIWDGDYNLKHVITDYYSTDFNPLDGDTGTHEIVLPWEDPCAQWAFNEEQRIANGEKQIINVTCDYVGARISGRLSQLTVDTDEYGRQRVTMTFEDDYETLKGYDVWSNPFLPAAFQFPRVFILPGPLRWVLKTTLFLQVLREQTNLWSLPDDPMDLGSFASGFSMSNWMVLINPTSLIEDLAAGSIWGVACSRWKNFHDMQKPMTEDAEYSWKLRRFLKGDPVPEWCQALGFEPAHGALIVDLVDESGTYVGTSHGGTMFDGLFRTIGDFTEDFIETDYVAIADAEIPDEYKEASPFARFTRKERPFVVYSPDMPSVKSMQYLYKPAKFIQINTGGHSMPGVNEAISAGIQALGDIIGNQLQIGSIGGSIDTLLKPFYEDTVLAWMSVKLLMRSMKQGKSRLFEYFQEGADKAYTISAMMVMRTGVWATRTIRQDTIEITDGGPWLLGDQGVGHFWLSSRVGAMVPGDTRKQIYMDRVRGLKLHQERGQRPRFDITIGDNTADEDPATAAWGRIESLISSVKDLGVF
ncbi:minor tail protein [Gordonia phage Troje]|uniref:Minor tail protein n=1 Tax=Gordonia phage Troje TaxID=2079282 RepID=A0A2K9VEP1_9CAUD|nr:minor tail protein [Gordonia phage Troje]AUV60724.1 minor tail protein [Gordonia phage Troje]QDM56296.1 minor tail protein [Gordonia phage SweatNTears]WKW85083.1 minor tail protein [Gordonia phage Yummy]WKW86894.1 minor tail protein [Gordonia phage Horseradish]